MRTSLKIGLLLMISGQAFAQSVEVCQANARSPEMQRLGQKIAALNQNDTNALLRGAIVGIDNEMRIYRECAGDPGVQQYLQKLSESRKSMWLIQPPSSGGGQLHTEEIRKVGPWPATATAKERLTGFHCVSGAIFVMRQGHMLRAEERGMHWSSGGKFRLKCRPGEL